MNEQQTNDAGENTSVTIQETLHERGTRYGSFAQHAQLSQALSQTIVQHYFKVHENPKPLPPFMIESIQMICHKLARIANGDPFYDDSWKDIGGYSQLVVDILHEQEGSK